MIRDASSQRPSAASVLVKHVQAQQKAAECECAAHRAVGGVPMALPFRNVE